jgi:L-ascorbate metabolism protein UlaG (beta-lactamase superfamily)
VIEPSTSGSHIWWLGQSGFLIGCDGRHLLVDPYLSDSLTRKYEGTETPHVRMHPRVVAPEELAFVDVVLATHGHTDHLDAETLRAVAAPLVAPARIAGLARERSGGAVTPISEGETVDAGGFRVTAVPAVHPGEHCVGYVVEAGGRRFYHSGDTTWVDPGVRGVDVAFLPINGKLNNLDGPEAARLALLVEAGLAVPCHYDMFEFNTATPEAFVAECERLGQPCRVLRGGERVTLPA